MMETYFSFVSLLLWLPFQTYVVAVYDFSLEIFGGLR